MRLARAIISPSTFKTLGLGAAILSLVPAEVHAAISVEPVVLDIYAPTAASAVRLRNDDQSEVTVQTRVFQWVQKNGQESLLPATDVAASPPIVTLRPGSDYTVRVVRTADAPVRGEESYRILVDELPPPRKGRDSSVDILIRQSIPVFFRAPGLTLPDVSWSYRLENDQVEVVATNNGDDRLRIASLRLRDKAGKEISFGNGLIGYVLGHSSMTFTRRLIASDFTAGETVAIDLETNIGHIQASASRHARP